MKLNEHVVSVLKRNDRKDLLKLFVEKEESIKLIDEANRITAALIDKVAALEASEASEPVEPEELNYQDDINEEAEKNDKLIQLEGKVRKAIKKGNYKKAKKALKELLATGIEGSEIDALKKEVKGLKDGSSK